VAACSDDTTAEPINDPAQAADQALDEAASQPNPDVTGDGAPSTTAPDTTTTTTTTTIPGIQVDETTLQYNECFDQRQELVAGRTRTITTQIECRHPHRYQVFGDLSYPALTGTEYPGRAIVEDYGLSSCYQMFEDWSGSVYETSALDIRVFIPSQSDFEDIGYRRIICFVERFDGDLLVGSALGQGL